jgi:hypothetical protein
MASVRIAPERLLHQQRQAIEALAHIGVTGRQPHPCTSRQRDHRRRPPPASVAIIIASVAGSIAPLIRIRDPFANSTSIKPPVILFEKYSQHQPLNRQSERYACEGIDLSVSTLADQVGGCAALLRPLCELIRAHVFAGERVHGDETPVPVLAKHQTRKGRLWTYVRDDKPFAGPAPPAAVFFYSRDRTAQHPESHLRDYAGIVKRHPIGTPRIASSANVTKAEAMQHCLMPR